MTSEQMSEAIAAAKVGDYVLVQHTGSDRAVRYRVARTYGGRARQLELVGVRGAKRVLVDGGAQIWLRESVAGQRRATKDEAHRRVTSVRACDAHGQRLDTAEVWQDVGQKLDFYVDSPTPVVDIARAQLPEGYEVGTVGAGYVAILEGDQPEEVGPERANPWEAVVDAWRDCEEMREAEIGELQSALINARGRESQFVDNARACEETALRDALNEGLEPTRVTVAGGSTLDALGFTKQVTHSRCPDCNDTGVLAGFGFGTSVNACDRPCPCSPPKDDGPSEWTLVERIAKSSTWCMLDIVFAKGADRWISCIYADNNGTYVWRDRYGDFGPLVDIACVPGEHCVDMAIARLLCGLRDGTVRP